MQALKHLAWATVGVAGLALVAGCPAAEEIFGGGGIEDRDLGVYDISDTGDYALVELDVPSEAVGVMVECGGYGDDALGAVWTLTGPNGEIYTGDNPDYSKYRSDFVDARCPTVLPMTPNVELEPGLWTFNYFIGQGNGGQVDCSAVIRKGAAGNQGDVHVELVFVTSALDAASAQEDADFQAAVNEFARLWKTAGLNPTFTYKDFSGDTARFSVVDVTETDYSEFNDLLRTTDPDNRRSVTFFLVEEISGSGDTILGLSGGPPGASTVPASSKSGVVITTVDYASAPLDVARIMAHEGGHFLGLWHPSEKAGDQHDPLDDTPRCTSSDDTNSNDVINSAECEGKGAANVMFWTLNDTLDTFSDDQGWVVRRNPAVR